jgi:hypothetical protein
MKHFTLFLAFLLSSAAAYAGGIWTDAKITNIAVYTSAPSAPKGYVLVTFASTGTGTPSCASGYPRNIAIDVSSTIGELALSEMQKSVLIGLSVTVTGTGTCSVIPTAETLASIQTRASD